MPTDQPHPISDADYEVPWWREKYFLKRLIISLVSAAIIAVLGYFFAYPAFQDFRKKRIVRIAQAFVATEDFRSAYLLLDQYLKIHPENLEARRLLAKVLEEYGPGQGLPEWETLVKLEPGNSANYIGYITSALRVRQIQKLPEALATLQKLQPNGIDYHRLSAGLALVTGDVVALRQSIEALAQADPENPTTQFNLATLRLNSSVVAEVSAAREALEKFGRGDTFRIRAALALVDDAPKRWPKEKDPAKLYRLIVRQLEIGKSSLDSPSGFMKTGAIRLRDPGLESLLEHLQTQPSPTPEDVSMLTRWLLKIGRAREALVWLETLPLKTRESPSALASMAACAVGLEAWDKLEEVLLQGAWGPVPSEAVKYAFQARLLREQKNDSRAETIWNNAVKAAEQSLTGMRMLHRLVQVWHWPGKEAQVLWALVRRFPNDSLAWRQLADQVLTTRDTKQVWRLYNAWTEATPSNLQAQIERVVVGLLVRPQEAGLAGRAAELFRLHPNNPGCRLAQALALWRGGLNSEALIVLDAVPLNLSAEPRAALTRGLVLGSLGRRTESERMFVLVPSEVLLPEEAALIAAARVGAK